MTHSGTKKREEKHVSSAEGGLDDNENPRACCAASDAATAGARKIALFYVLLFC